MFSKHRMHSTLIGAALAAVLVPAAAAAQGIADRDTREVQSYVLTEAALAKYTQATKNLGPLAKKLSDDCDDSDGPKSLDDSVARFNAVAGAQAAVKSAGMTTREYVVFTWSLFQTGMAAWVLDQPGGKLPAGVSKANVNFYKQHEAAIQKLKPAKKSGDCDDEASGDDSQDG